jgi:hypothetical protein
MTIANEVKNYFKIPVDSFNKKKWNKDSKVEVQ